MTNPMSSEQKRSLKSLLAPLEAMIRHHAAEQIMPRFNEVSYQFKRDGSLVTAADSAMQKAMMDDLQEKWPEYLILGEEMSAQQQQDLLDADFDPDSDSDFEGLWLLDPLDGTSNFASGIPIFSVSIALVVKQQVVLGMIYDPNQDEVFSAVRGEGAWFNGEPLKASSERESLSQCTAQIDFKRLTEAMRVCLCKDHPYASQRNFGSGALDWCWLAMARSQVYIHGGQKLWDYAAGHLIFQEAGGIAKTFAGEAMYVNSLQARSVMAAVNQPLFDELQKYLTSLPCRQN